MGRCMTPPAKSRKHQRPSSSRGSTRRASGPCAGLRLLPSRQWVATNNTGELDRTGTRACTASPVQAREREDQADARRFDSSIIGDKISWLARTR